MNVDEELHVGLPAGAFVLHHVGEEQHACGGPSQPKMRTRKTKRFTRGLPDGSPFLHNRKLSKKEQRNCKRKN